MCNEPWTPIIVAFIADETRARDLHRDDVQAAIGTRDIRNAGPRPAVGVGACEHITGPDVPFIGHFDIDIVLAIGTSSMMLTVSR